MPSDSSPQLIAIGILLCLSAFFSASETALTSFSKLKLRSMVEAGVKGAARIEKLTKDPNKMLSSILVGSNLVNIAMSSLATALAITLFGNDASSIGIAAIIVAVLILIFGEITPKTYAAGHWERLSFLLAPLIQFVIYILTPVVVVLNLVTGFILKLLGNGKNTAGPSITETELKTIVDVSHEEGVIEASEKRMINNVFDFGDSDATDVMTPRTDIFALPLDANYHTVLSGFKERHFSRAPIYENDMDHIVGFLHFKDFIFSDMDEKNFDIHKLLRPPFFSYESKLTSELFAEMRTEGISMAIILDEYGGTAGLVTVQDLVEEIVGDISDEYDDGEEEFIRLTEDEYSVDGAMRLDDFNEMTNSNLESDEYESIAGYVIELLGAIPDAGAELECRPDEELPGQSIKFIIEEMDKNRIARLRVVINRPVQKN